jgi:hypothetical protein
MSLPDSSAIDSALLARLQADTALAALLPDGVWMDEAPQGSQRFVIVSLVDANDEAVFGGRAIEEVTYLVKAVALSTANGNVRAAAARIDAILEDGALTVDGYTFMDMHRTGRIRGTEVDDLDASLRWLHRGGRYQVRVSLGEAAPVSWMDTGWVQP